MTKQVFRGIPSRTAVQGIEVSQGSFRVGGAAGLTRESCSGKASDLDYGEKNDQINLKITSRLSTWEPKSSRPKDLISVLPSGELLGSLEVLLLALTLAAL